MRAAVIAADGVSVETRPDPVPGPREVIVQVAECGICGTDVHIADGEFAPALPITPGHELAGEVVAVGTAVGPDDGVRAGDQVVVDPTLFCGECRSCRRGRGNHCRRMGAIGVTTGGGAAEFAAAPVANCVVLPERVRPADAPLIEPLACAVHGFDLLAPALGDHYLIYGAGTVGLMMMELAKRAGAASVDIVDIDATRLESARALGCSNAVVAADELDHPHDYDVVIDGTGVVAAIEDGLARVVGGGTFLLFGVAKESSVVRFSPFEVYRREIRILGSKALVHSFERATELFAGGLIRPEVMISHRRPLAEFPTALEEVRAGVGRKLHVVP